MHRSQNDPLNHTVHLSFPMLIIKITLVIAAPNSMIKQKFPKQIWTVMLKIKWAELITNFKYFTTRNIVEMFSNDESNKLVLLLFENKSNFLQTSWDLQNYLFIINYYLYYCHDDVTSRQDLFVSFVIKVQSTYSGKFNKLYGAYFSVVEWISVIYILCKYTYYVIWLISIWTSRFLVFLQWTTMTCSHLRLVYAMQVNWLISERYVLEYLT